MPRREDTSGGAIRPRLTHKRNKFSAYCRHCGFKLPPDSGRLYTFDQERGTEISCDKCLPEHAKMIKAREEALWDEKLRKWNAGVAALKTPVR